MRREPESANRPPDAWFRVSLFIGPGLLVAVPYFEIQRHPLFSATLIPLTSFDRAVPFWEPAIWLYLSFYLLLALPLLLARDRENLYQMAFGFGWIAAISHSLFLVWPTAVPALTSSAQGTSPPMRLVLAALSPKSLS